jgi:hypothetical protein
LEPRGHSLSRCSFFYLNRQRMKSNSLGVAQFAEAAPASFTITAQHHAGPRYIPKGADFVLNPVSGAPGFWIGNVIVMAGVPSIMQAMLDEVGPKLKTGICMFSETVRADVRESDIGTQLGEIAKANPEVTIGSHPFFDLSLFRRAGRVRACFAALARHVGSMPSSQPRVASAYMLARKASVRKLSLLCWKADCTEGEWTSSRTRETVSASGSL